MAVRHAASEEVRSDPRRDPQRQGQDRVKPTGNVKRLHHPGQGLLLTLPSPSQHLLRLVVQSGLTLCDPTDCSPPGSSVHWGFSRQEYWSGLPCSPPGDLPNPGIKPASPVSSVLKSVSLLLSQWGGHTSCFSIRLKIQNKIFSAFFHPVVL